MRTGEIVFLGLCVLAAIRPLSIDNNSRAIEPSIAVTRGFPGWAAVPALTNLQSLKLSDRDAEFAAHFPGMVAAFADGRNTWIARWVAKPTRKLHPAADCLRATGYAVHPEPIFADASGAHWGATVASRGSERLTVHERIVDANGREFTDVSMWFWSAVLEKSAGPWWCLTRIESASRP